FGWKRLVLLALVAVLGAGALTASVPQLRERFARTALAWDGSERGVGVFSMNWKLPSRNCRRPWRRRAAGFA
ncbi:MAG TPA: hypothetical protein VN063_03115, partial [Methylophilaceae bacterium]|nr:hypothetical protein [Methylophilaceae bacterium]